MAATSTLKRVLSVTGNFLFTVLLLFLVVMVFFVVKGKMEGGAPSIAGYKLYIVLSGSMVPVFDTGSVIGVKDVEPKQVAAGDIITFKDPKDPNRIVTHRVVEVINDNGQLGFVTRGDANEDIDSVPVPEDNLIGRARFWVPYAGYALDYTRSKKGLLTLVVIPGVLFILFELRNLYKYAKQHDEEEKRKKQELEAGPRLKDYL